MPAEDGKPDNLATTVTEVSERVTLLIRDEIELAKLEIMQKVSSLAKGLAVGAAAAVFGIFALIYVFATAAWGLASLIGHIWLGFLIVLVVLIALTVGAGLFAYRKLNVGAPTPKMAIDEAKKIRATVGTKPDIHP